VSPGKKQSARGTHVPDPWSCPLQPEREGLKAAEDAGTRVCGYLSDVWPLESALTLEGMSEADWKIWRQDEDNRKIYDRAKKLHRLRIDGQIRAMAVGLSFRRAQLPALRFLQRGLNSEKPPARKSAGTSPSAVRNDEPPTAAEEYGPMNDQELEDLRTSGWPDDDSDDNEE